MLLDDRAHFGHSLDGDDTLDCEVSLITCRQSIRRRPVSVVVQVVGDQNHMIHIENALILDQQCQIGQIIGPESQQRILSGRLVFTITRYQFVRTYLLIKPPSPVARA